MRVLYILGVSRSGSTVFSSLLGSHPRVIGVGELTHLHPRLWESGHYCSCGASTLDCKVWSGVRALLDQPGAAFDPHDYGRLKPRFEPYPLDRRGWVRLARQRAGRTPEFERYVHLTTSIFESLARTTQAEVIVDATKEPGRCVALAQCQKIDLRVIHLVRDSRAVAWSLSKEISRDAKLGVQRFAGADPVWRGGAHWTLTNALSEAARLAVGRERFLRVRYEDFVLHPRETLARVGAFMGVDYAATIDAVEKGESLNVEHIIAGNRVRMKGPVRLQLDTEWTRLMPLSDQLQVRATTEPLLRRYDYVRRPSYVTGGTGKLALARNRAGRVRTLGQEEAAVAGDEMARVVGRLDLGGLRLLDVGSGAGLHSLAARNLGASVVSIDVDPDAVTCTRMLKDRFRHGDGAWVVQQGSILDSQLIERLGRFDVIWARDVLSECGDLWRALEHISAGLGPRGVAFVTVDEPSASLWRAIRCAYASAPASARAAALGVASVMGAAGNTLERTATRPLQAASPSEIFGFATRRGLRVRTPPALPSAGVGYFLERS
ncbi:MAG: sulfotransferase [Sandaracinaceae bacterium]|nr:sulfotransferase [Sandaracinaceae bacterium]